MVELSHVSRIYHDVVISFCQFAKMMGYKIVLNLPNVEREQEWSAVQSMLKSHENQVC